MLPGSWMGPTPSKEAEIQEPVTTQKRSALNTEYKLKFRPFSDYTYVDGHFTGAKDTTDGGEADRTGAAATPPTPWYEEVLELRKKASSYKMRGWGREMAQPHLAHLYDREEEPCQLAERKIISALYLETLKPGFVREDRGRSPVTTGGASVRQQSHPPPSSRKSPGAAKMALKLHAAEGSKRPHSAQPSTDRHTGDVVDRAKGRSPATATPRTPTSRPETAATAAAKPRKRPTERPPSIDKAEKAARPPAAARPPPAEKKADRPVRPPTEKTEKKAEKPPRPATARSERSSRPVPGSAAPAPSSGTPESAGGKGIRGGTPRSRSAHRLAAKAKSPTKAERPLSTAMTTSAPAAGSAEEAKPAAEEAKPAAEETKPAAEPVKPTAKPDEVESKPADEPAVTAARTTAEAQPAQEEERKPPPADVAQAHEEPVKPAADEPTDDSAAGRTAEEVVRSVPEPTRVKSPEGMAPIKSPEPVNWTVPLDTGKTFTVTQNVMGGHGSPMSSRADSLRSPTEDSTRSPMARGVTDVSHLRNGEPAPPPAESPLANDVPATNGRDTDLNHQLTAGAGTAEDHMQGSFHADAAEFGAQSDVIRSLQDPMTASMTGDDLKRSLMGEDPMTASMTGEDLKRSLHDPMATSMTEDDLTRPPPDPMTASMTGDDLKRSLHDPMTSSMTGDELQRSFHADEPADDAAMTASFHAPPPAVPPPRPAAQRVLDDPLMAAATFSRPAEPPPSLPERPPTSSLFSTGSAGPPRFSHELFGSAGRPAEQKPDAAEKPLYRVI